MPRALTTIAIAAYRSRREYFAAALESALAQTWGEVDIIVADDSPDPSLRAVVEAYGDARVRYRHNPRSLGVAENYWSCFREARGEYVAVLNHDDVLAPTFVERLAPPLIEDRRLAVAFCDQWIIDRDGRRLADETERASARWGRSGLPAGVIAPCFRLLAPQSIPISCGAILRRRLLPSDAPPHAGPAYDLWLAYLLCRGGHDAYYVPDRLASWRDHPDNLTSQRGVDWTRGAAECWRAVSRDANLTPLRGVARLKAAQSYFACAVASWRAGDRAGCLVSAGCSLAMRPTWRAAAACVLPVVPVVVDTWRKQRGRKGDEGARGHSV